MEQLTIALEQAQAGMRQAPEHAEEPMTQCDILARAFANGERLTVKTALERYGVYALSQRCGELRKQDMPILDQRIKLPSGKTVKEYWMALPY